MSRGSGGKVLPFAGYLAFLATVLAAVGLASRRPDLVPVDYGELSSQYATILAGLGGFAITVLAVMLGLEALDTIEASPLHRAARRAMVRHVALSLTAASITCFIGASMLAEVSALSASLKTKKSEAAAELRQYMVAGGLDDIRIAAFDLRLEQARRERDANSYRAVVDDIRKSITAREVPSSQTTLRLFDSRRSELELIEVGSSRRLSLLANLPAFLSSLLILHSLMILLVVRYPNDKRISLLQHLVVLAFGAMLMVKLLHAALQYVEERFFLPGLALIAVVMLTSIFGYRKILRAVPIADTRASDRIDRIANFMPLMPYASTLVLCFLAFVVLAATFRNYGPATAVDCVLVLVGTPFAVGLLLAVQIENPTQQILAAEPSRDP